MVVATMAVLAAAGPARAEELSLGSYEQAALDRALQRTGLKVDPAPDGKRVRRIVVVNLDVFGPDEGFLQWFNLFHRTTRPAVIAREVLLRPGHVWDAEVVADSRRRLDDDLFSTLVVIVPAVVSDAEIDLLVVTRDIWSLRLNSTFEFQESSLTALSLSLAENNFLGWRKHVALVFQMNQGAYSLGPQYFDPNIRGTRLRLLVRSSLIFSRADSELEGSSSALSFSYPLWSLKPQWSAALTATHYSGVARIFRGLAIDEFEASSGERIPRVYDDRQIVVEPSATRQLLADGAIHRITVGHEIRVRRPELPDDFPDVPDDVRDEFIDEELPRSERSSAPLVRYQFFIPEYVTYRDQDTFDLPEERTLGPTAALEVAVAMPALGSEVAFVRMSASTGITVDLWRDGFARVAGEWTTKRQDGAYIDGRATGHLKIVSPSYRRTARLAFGLTVDRRINERNNRDLFLGGDSGMRGYPINAFQGQAAVRGNLELRTRPVKIWFGRAGLLAFWDFGHAAESFDTLTIHHDVGIGVRGVLPQLQPYVFRFDWAFPLTDPHDLHPGFRFTAGVQQVF